MLSQQKTESQALPVPGKEGFCPYCKRPTIFKHLEQFPGDGPFKVYQEPMGINKTPLIYVRKCVCSNNDCGKMVVTLDSPNWRGTLIPHRQYD